MSRILGTFLENVERSPDRVLARTREHAWTLGEVARDVSNRERELSRAGVRPGAIVAITAESGPGFLSAWLACRAIGACALLVDHALEPTERRGVAAKLGARAIWTVRALPEPLTRPGAFEPIERNADEGVSDGVAVIKVTSGSTGEPAGVRVSESALAADGYALIESMGIRGSDRILASIPLTHSYGFSVVATPAWLSGVEVVFPIEQDPLACARAARPTVLPSVPSWYRATLEGERRAPGSIRLFLSAAAPLGRVTARAWREREGRGIHVLYGSTECGGITYDRRGDAAERGTVGTPVLGVDVELEPVDETRSVVVVRSDAVALGYHAAAPDDSPRLRDGRFRTEDLGEFVGDELVLGGRLSHWVNVKGRKVDPLEVQGVLESMPGIDEALVLAVELPGERGQALRAFVSSTSESLSYRDIVVWCRSRLAGHKVPRSVVRVDAIPRNARGKVDRARLRALAPDAARPPRTR